MLTKEQFETIYDLREIGYFYSHSDPITGEAYAKKRVTGLRGGPPEYSVIVINKEGEITDDE